jgi:hypothetical protein
MSEAIEKSSQSGRSAWQVIIDAGQPFHTDGAGTARPRILASELNVGQAVPAPFGAGRCRYATFRNGQTPIRVRSKDSPLELC